MKKDGRISTFHSPEAGQKAALYILIGIFLAHLGQYNQGIATAQTVEIIGKSRPYKPFDAVALYGFTVLFRESNAHYGLIFFGDVQDGKIPRVRLFTLFEQPLELVVFFKP